MEDTDHMTDADLKSFQEASYPLMKWMSENVHPHCLVVLDSERAELVEGRTVAQRRLMEKELEDVQ